MWFHSAVLKRRRESFGGVGDALSVKIAVFAGARRSSRMKNLASRAVSDNYEGFSASVRCELMDGAWRGGLILLPCNKIE
ncbi:hypothetical protein CO654_32495 [Rhizobium sp. L18]|nr:hypothetical protein CO654_32495 [Rhizobium sp. L18]